MSRQKLAFAICDFLNKSVADGTITGDSVEGIEVAIQCIGEAFGIDPSDPSLAIHPATLESIFQIFLSTQQKISAKPVEKKEDQKAKAEQLKSLGNKEMAAKKYSEAIDLYTQAIAADGTNPIYFGNRAAAHSQNGSHDQAVADAKHALSLDPLYHKAYSRLGHAEFCLGNYENAVQAYRKALEADPSNANIKASLNTAEQKLGAAATTQRAMPDMGATGGMPDLGGMDLGSMMNNPAFMSMASQMMSNPAFSSMLKNPQVAQMAQSLMQDPDALKNLMSNPEVSKMANDMLKK